MAYQTGNQTQAGGAFGGLFATWRGYALVGVLALGVALAAAYFGGFFGGSVEEPVLPAAPAQLDAQPAPATGAAPAAPEPQPVPAPLPAD